MQAPESGRKRQRPTWPRQAGATVVEFALVVLLFLAFLFAVIDLARLMFLYNTLQEATRRAASAASVADASNATAMNNARRNAIFRNSAGGLILMPELTDAAIRIDYLSLIRDASGAYSQQVVSGGASLKPAQIRHNCLVDPYSSGCVRLVRARVCDPQAADACIPMQFRPSITFFGVLVPLPIATTLVKYQPYEPGSH